MCILYYTAGFENANCGLTCCLCNILKILYTSRWVAEMRSDMSRLPRVSCRAYALDALDNTTSTPRQRLDLFLNLFFIKPVNYFFVQKYLSHTKRRRRQLGGKSCKRL